MKTYVMTPNGLREATAADLLQHERDQLELRKNEEEIRQIEQEIADRKKRKVTGE